MFLYYLTTVSKKKSAHFLAKNQAFNKKSVFSDQILCFALSLWLCILFLSFSLSVPALCPIIFLLEIWFLVRFCQCAFYRNIVNAMLIVNVKLAQRDIVYLFLLLLFVVVRFFILFCFVPGFHNFTFILESSIFMWLPKNMHKTRNTIEFRYFIKRMHQQQCYYTDVQLHGMRTIYECFTMYMACVIAQ